MAQARIPGALFVLALQLPIFSSFEMSLPSVCLVSPAPKRPFESMVDWDASLSKFDGDAADFLDRPADQERCLARRRADVFFGAGSALAR